MHGSERKLRVAMVAACPFPCPRGTPIRVHRLAESLARRGHEMHVIAYHLHLEESASDPGFAIHRMTHVPTYRRLEPGPTVQKLLIVDPLLRMKLKTVVREYRPDVIHAHHYEGMLVSLGLEPEAARPLIFDAHTLLESELPYYARLVPRALKRRIGRYLDRTLPRRAAAVIAVSESIRETLLSDGRIPEDRVTVIPNGVEPALFQDPAAPQTGSGGPKRLVYAGNLAPYQGIELMLEAFRRVQEQRSDVRLQLVTGASFERYLPLARRLGVEDHIDVVPAELAELPRQLARAEIALNPRIDCSGVSQKLLNYMAAGKAVVSFAGSATGLRHGRTGWVVPDGDVDGFAAAILRLLQDPELSGRLGRGARGFARAERSWDAMAARAEAVYLDLLSRPG